LGVTIGLCLKETDLYLSVSIEKERGKEERGEEEEDARGRGGEVLKCLLHSMYPLEDMCT